MGTKAPILIKEESSMAMERENRAPRAGGPNRKRKKGVPVLR